MDTFKILFDLRAERDRIDRAISAIEALESTAGSARRPGRPPGRAQAAGKPRRRRRLSAATRKRLSEMMKARWVERKKRAKAS
jgi:hypothetical protein